MTFDLSSWGFVRPAIHCNVVIFKFISERSLAPSVPELGFLSVSLSREKKAGGERESEAPFGSQPVQRALLGSGGRSRASRAPAGSLDPQEGLSKPVWGTFPRGRREWEGPSESPSPARSAFAASKILSNAGRARNVPGKRRPPGEEKSAAKQRAAGESRSSEQIR